MTYPISAAVWHILACSACGGELRKTATGGLCVNCGLEYPFTPSGSLDLRLQKPKTVPLEFVVGAPWQPEQDVRVEPLRLNPQPGVDFSDVRIPRHLTKEILSYIPGADTTSERSNAFALDLGCGGAIHQGVCERAGYEWVGLDYSSLDAPILGDAHALPFKDNSVDFVLSIAVLEHIRYPFVMLSEVNRVLKPGGKFIGTVSFLEPHHSGSLYHHTHLGVINTLQYGGFTVDKVAPSEQWSVLMAQARMGLFPRMPRWLSQTMVYPVYLLHILWWWAGRLVSSGQDPYLRIRNTTGSFTFIATRKLG